MLTQPITDARAWRADTIDPPAGWSYRLPERCLAALDRTVQELRCTLREPTALRLAETPCADCADDLRPALAALETGRGFVILEGVPVERYAPAELQALYWLVGQLLGQPMAQNVQGTLLYDVRDTGQEVRYGARFSVTNAESTFHTDNSFGAEVLDYVGLLCLTPARAGGLSQVVSGYAVHNELLRRDPDALAPLYEPFHVDRRGGVRPGEPPTARVPVFAWDGRELVCRYLRYWIEAGHAKAGEPLPPARVRALDTLDAVLNEPALRVEFLLKPGDMFFINNRWIFHNRTAFEDHAEPQRKRHYVRLWLQRHAGGRDTPVRTAAAR
jgi:alpha-ketoglutarate-dependent taurine dioxygenase